MLWRLWLLVVPNQGTDRQWVLLSCCGQLKIVLRNTLVWVLLKSKIPSSMKVYFCLIHLHGLWGCLSVMCSLWCHKESFKYNLLKGKQCCPKHVMHPMLRASHSYLQSFEFILSTNKCLKLRCYGWQYAHNLYHLPHVTTLMGQAPIKQIFEGLPQKLIQRNHMVGFL